MLEEQAMDFDPSVIPGTDDPDARSGKVSAAERERRSRPAENAETSVDGGRPIAAGDLAGRLLRVLVGLACYFVLELLVKALTLLQLLYVAWKKRPQRGIQRLGAMIGDYTNSLWRYCTFSSDTAPWPFSPWPRGELETRR
jgi:hypothetical protein